MNELQRKQLLMDRCFKHGYNKALEDVEKIINNFFFTRDNLALKYWGTLKISPDEYNQSLEELIKELNKKQEKNK